jgi:hypothetical protein
MRCLLALAVALGGCGFPHPADVPGDATPIDSPTADTPPAARFTSFQFLVSANADLAHDVAGQISAGEVVVSVPFDTPVTHLVATFAATGDVSVGGSSQQSGFTANDFSSPVVYSVAAQDGSTTNIPVVVNTADPTVPDFSTATAVATGMRPVALATADIDGDDKPDLVVANSFSTAVSVLLDRTPPGALHPTFAPRADIPTGLGPRMVATADFNRDGKVDLAVVNGPGNNVSILLNTTAPRASAPTFATKVDIPLDQGPTSIASADFNHDGIADLVIGNPQQSTISVLVGTTPAGAATPTFATKVDVTTDAGPAAIAIGDFNRDGRPDVATVNTSGSVAVLLDTMTPGATTAAFASRVSLPTGTNPTAIAAADVDGNGAVDLVVADQGGSTVSVLLNQTAAGASIATFAAKLDVAQSTAPTAVALSDLDGDGRPDIITTQSTATITANLTTSAAGSAPMFSAPSTFALDTAPGAIAIADFNGDGKPDVAAAGSSMDVVDVVTNLSPWPSTLDLQTKNDATTGTNPASLVIADFNNDGRPDVATPNSNAASVSVLLDTTTPGHSTASFANKVDVPVGNTPSAIAAGDFNSDGKVDLAIVNRGANSVSVVLSTTSAGAATASFAAKLDLSTAQLPQAVVVTDVDLDGRPDIVIGTGAAVTVFLDRTAPNAATATFASPVDVAIGGTALAVGDFDGDGRPDLVAVVGNNTQLLVNTTPPGATSPAFAAPVTVANVVGALAVADLDADGLLDVAIATSNQVSIARGLGGAVPTFSAPLPFTSGAGTTGLVIADITRDGRPDLAFANIDSNSASILRATSPPGGMLTYALETGFATGLVPLAAGVTDINLDGHPDLIVAATDASAVATFLAH